MARSSTLVVVAALLIPGAVRAQEQELGEAYLARLLEVWGQDSSASEVEALVSLFSDDVVYEHPRVGIRLEGRGTIADGLASFLGSSRRPQATSIEIVTGPGVFVIGFDLRMEVQQGAAWSAIERRQVVVLEVTEGRIVRVTDHW